MVLTKADMTKALAQAMKLKDKQEAIQFTEEFFNEIAGALEKGESVKLSGFGTFRLLNKKPRIGRNPHTGKPASIAARRVVTFNPSENLKKKISE